MKFQRNLEAKKLNILLRVDLNVPTFNGKVIDDTKIIALKKTLEDLIRKKNKIFLLSHFGRPKGKINHNFSLKFLSNRIEKTFKLGKVNFLDNCIGSKIKKKIIAMKYGEICLLENVRFHEEEENNNIYFSKKLSENFDIYINDAFSTSHRCHSSIVGVTKFLPSYAGYLFEKEITELENVMKSTCKPTMAIIGGSKVSTKISILKNLVKNFDYLIIAGGMANTFLAAKGYNVGSSNIEKDFFKEVIKIEKNSLKRSCNLILPTDVIASSKLINAKDAKRYSINNINENKKIFDIGPNSCNTINELFSKVRTVLWNGPLGAFENKPFDNSTKIISKFLISKINKYNLKVILGGGDTIASLKNLNVLDKFSYVSNSGGAFLEWLEGKKLPGIIALEKNKYN